MLVQSTATDVAQVACDAMVVGLYADGKLAPILARVDEALGGALQRLIAQEEISGKRNKLATLLSPAGLQAEVLVVVGLGEPDQVDQAVAFQAAGAAAKHLASRPRGRVVFSLDHHWDGPLTTAAVCGAIVGCVGQDLYRAERRLTGFDELLWPGADPQALAAGQILGTSINTTRRLVNESPSVMTPARFADEAKQVAEQHGLEVEIWDAARLERERCAALLAVARASANPPRLVTLNYYGASSGHPALALVGKGVTFDSGGLSLKPGDAMKTMKCDMAGGATVVGSLLAIAQLQLPVNVIGLVGLVENMIGGNAYKLGDVLTARNGKTIEVLNTDAEGRLVLADVLDVAVQHDPARIITLATLTGACMVALGTDVAGLMTNNQPWCDAVFQAATTCGEPVWQLPMFAEYGEQITSEVADIKNIGEGRWGGAITAAKLLEHFVADKPWVHVDIAGPAFLEKPKPWLDGGGSGVMVRTLATLVASLS